MKRIFVLWWMPRSRGRVLAAWARDSRRNCISRTASGYVTNALSPATTFRGAGIGADASADRYVNPVDVTVPNLPPGARVNLIMRAWRNSAGSYDNADYCGKGQSAPFTITLGGGDFPPAPLTGLQGFTFGLECTPVISAINLKNGQVIITADYTTDQTQLLGTTNFLTWTSLNVPGTLVWYRRKTFAVNPGSSYEYYRLEEP